MIVDGDGESEKFKKQLVKRGFVDDELLGRFRTHAPPNGLEDQLLADGHEGLLRTLLASVTSESALTCPQPEFTRRLKNQKIPCISQLALTVETNPVLAARMPSEFVQAVSDLKAGTYG